MSGDRPASRVRASPKRPWAMPNLPKAHVAHENVAGVVTALISPDAELSCYVAANAMTPEERQRIARLILEAHLQATAWRTYSIVSSAPQYARSALGALRHLSSLSNDQEFRTSLLLARDCIMAMPSAADFSQVAFEEITQLHQIIQSPLWDKALEPLATLVAETDRKAKRSKGGKPQSAYRRMFVRYLIVEYANRIGRLPPKGAKEDAKKRRSAGASFHEFVRAALADVGIRVDLPTVTKAIRDEISRMLKEREDKTPPTIAARSPKTSHD